MSTLISQKRDLRKILIKKRDEIKKNASVEFNYNVFKQLNEFIDFEKINDVASFASIRSEISTTQLNNEIIELGKNLSFPVIVKNSNQLIFKRANANGTFKLGKFNIPEPVNDKNDVIPQLFFVPCLGFDMKGFRLGYGGGFYDRYIEKVTDIKSIVKIGLAFSYQETKKIPINKYDKKLDFIITEKNILK